MRISHKLLLGFAIIILFIGVIGLVNWKSFKNIEGILNELNNDIVPGALAMTEMKGSAEQIAHKTIEYMLTHNPESKAEVRAAMEELQKSTAEHKAHEKHIGLEEKKEAEKLEEEAKQLISRANEIIDLKDRRVPLDVLLKKENEELREVLSSFTGYVISHKAEHLEELAIANAQVFQIQARATKYIRFFSKLVDVLDVESLFNLEGKVPTVMES
ncbi:MAG: MCP four helix bundle domain-containing protein, partial [Deltaproteobacteria bacterium]|nr:MCP four helix bundle domain-containing protein [Deltaproteobacteria bacterium]